MSFGVEPSEGPDEAIYSTPLMLRWIARCTSDWIRSGIDAKSSPAGAFIFTDVEYDLHLNNGRLLEHFHEGNLTYRIPGIHEKTPDTFVEVSPQLAGERHIQSGAWVELTSRYGKVRAQAVITTRVHGKELYMPMNSTEEAVNRLTSSHTDKATHTPAYKETSVQLRVLGEIGDDPLPRTNSRHGHPTPQTGVEVERKWKRKDYRQPGNHLIQIQTR